MAEFKLGRLRFVWKDQWTTGTTYYKDDIIAYGGKTFLCVAGHTAAADFYTDLENIPTKWNQFADGQDWKGNWAATTLYKENDIVKYGGYVYICNNGHTSSTTLETNQANWDLFAESFDWKGAWATAINYKVNDLVKYGGLVYLCNAAHLSAATSTLGLEANQASWDLYSSGVDWKGAWTTSTRYKVGDVVKYGGTTYVCNLYHISAATTSLGLEQDQAKWDYFNQGVEYKGIWQGSSPGPAVRYKVNDIVKSGAGIYICVINHTSAALFATDYSAARWNQFVEGIEFEGEWSTSGIYQPGDIVRYGGNSFIAKTAHTASASFPPSTNVTDWDLFTTGFRLQGDWLIGTAYRVGEIVRNHGFTYIATADNTGQKPPNASYWSLLNQGIDWEGNWTSTTPYVLGDAVKFGPNSYICIQAHTSTASGLDRPDNDITGAYWNLLTAGNEESVLTTTGDLVYYSGSGPTRLPVGDEGQVLTVEGGLPAWNYFGKVAKVFYVAPHGINTPAPTYGQTVDKPWASVRYATEQIDKGVEYPNAGYLLKQNRTFIQKEIVEFVNYQITYYTTTVPTPSSIWYNFVNDSITACQRDMGLIVDAIVHDLTHSGNVKTLEATESYFLAGTLIAAIADEEFQLIEAVNYGLVLMSRVLSNTAPAQNYQTLNGIGAVSRIKQIIDATYVAETTAYTECAALAGIITDALAAGVNTGLPVLDTPNYTINVKTGQYFEVLPIMVPANTAVVGDELRSSRISPQVKLVETNDKAKSIATLQRLQSITDEIITNAAVTPTTGNTATQLTTSQKAGNVGSATAVSSVQANTTEIKDIVTNNTPNAYVRPTPTGGTGNAFTAGYLNAARLINANKAFLQDEVSTWILAQIAASAAGFVGFTYTGTRRTKCERDVGYIVDAVVYDLTYGGNLATQIAARAYYSFGVFLEPTAELAPALAVQLRIKDIIDNIATGNTAGWTKTTALTQDVSGTAGSAPAAVVAQDRIQEVYNTINTGTEPTTIAPDITWPAAALIAARTALNAARTQIRSDAVTHVKKLYPTLSFDETLCSRDVGYMVDALGYDLMFGSNFLSIQSGLAYRRGITSTNLVINSQLAATQTIIDFLSVAASKIAASGAVVLADSLWTDIIGYANTGTVPITVGTNLPTEDLDRINGAKILQLNKEFLVAEANAYIADTFKATVTASNDGTDTFTCSSQTWMVAGDTIRFTGTVFGGVSLNTTYYILSTGLTATTFKVSATLNGAAVNISTASGSMTVKWYYNSASCENDVRNYVEAIAYDLVYTGNYKSVLAARYYRNALTGSKLEDCFYVRNGCGLRNMTFLGLDGSSDGNTTGYQSALTTTPNEYGTKRPRAGAWVSLDPGWGPNDNRVWITTRSTYVQNVTTFGIGCVGQKIDGSLHNGGNDSIVSNDFTQVLSDGIGAWITNLGRAELVSVFSYYNYIGYLAENGGKIRATNGNNSYGTYGAVAEYIDITETPVTGVIDNRNTEADIRSVLTDGDQVLLYEFGNAGSAYTSATFTTSGNGASVATVGNEIRDGAAFQVRLVDPGDSTGAGGAGYITAQNLAQSGTTTAVTLAASDTSSSAAYVGMSVYIIAGLGAGQYGYITAYNSASKIAQVSKESTGTAGWDHVIPGTPILASLDITSNYEITPRISFSSPGFTKSTADMPSSQNWSDVVFGSGVGTYLTVSSTGGAGSLATFNVTRNYGVYSVEINAPGVLYVTGNTLTILGTSLGGTTPANDLTITVTSVSATGGIIRSVTSTGTSITPKYVAIAGGANSATTSAATSLDGVTWAAMTMPSSAQWVSIAYGAVSGIGYYVAIARESASAAYSRDGINWTLSNLGETADWSDIAYGNGVFVAISESDSSTTFRAWSSNNGATWNTNTFASGAKAIAYGFSRFVVVEGNFSNSVAYSTNGATWTVTTLPSNDDSTESNWVDIAYGNGRYVAISDSSAMAAYSFNGATWYKSNLPATYEWSSIGYGQGVFYVTSLGDAAASSPDGVTWTLRDGSYAPFDITATAKDTNTAYAETATLTSGTWGDAIWTGTKFVAVGYSGSAGLVATSATGASWTNATLPTVSSTFEYTTVAYNGTNQYVAIIGGGGGTRNIATSPDAVTWTGQLTALTAARTWKEIVYGAGRFMAVSADSAQVNFSTNGTSWTNAAIGGGTSENSAIAYGAIGGTDYFVIVTGYLTGSQTASYSTNNGVTWTSGNTLPSSDFWADVAFGNGRFVTVAGGTGSTSTKAAYSTNGTTWTAATLPGVATRWNKIVYGGGAFTAFAYNSNRTAYSVDGITWVEGNTQSATRNWAVAAYGNSRNVSIATGTTIGSYNDFVLNTNYLTTSSTTTKLNINDRIRFIRDSAGSEIFGGVRSDVVYYVTSVFDSTRFTISTSLGGSNFVLSTGSGSMLGLSSKSYTASALGNYQGNPNWVVLGANSQGVLNIRQGTKTRARGYVLNNLLSAIWIHEPGSGYTSAPTVTITDPNNTGADAPTVVRIGNGALSQPTFTNRGANYSAASATLIGDGYADNYQVGAFVGFKNLTGIPKSGANVQLVGIDDVWFRLVNVTGIIENAGLYSATLQISPPMGVAEAPEHETATTIRRRYSQVRLTGHDFLDIGTGNQTNTNYPGLPFTDPIPAYETVVGGGGRVFYTSTDQDGNFRVGGLFNVEQSTGVATLNADAFNIAGLNELSLGSVALGGSGATITEFSTDPFFTQDSDNIIPTQRAIKAYITGQIGGGGSSLNVNTLTAGVIYVAGQTITTTTNVQININTKVNFKGGIAGNALVLNYFLLNN
jgi:hypothetical protein